MKDTDPMGLHLNPIEGGHYEPDDPPELPDGWWDEDIVEQVTTAVKQLWAETVYQNGRKDEGISERFLARLTMLTNAVGLREHDDPFVADAKRVLGIEPV